MLSSLYWKNIFTFVKSSNWLSLKCFACFFSFLISIACIHAESSYSIKQPLRIKKMILKCSNESKTWYYLFRSDGDNFFIREVDLLRQINDPLRTGSTRVGGRWQNEIWTLWGEDKLMYRSTFPGTDSTNAIVTKYQKNTELRIDAVSRLPRSVLFYGLEPHFWSSNETNRLNSFVLDSLFGSLHGQVVFEPPKGDFVHFELPFEIRKGTNTRSKMIRGTVSSKNNFPIYIELYENEKKVLTREILELELSDKPLSRELFRPEDNVSGGYVAQQERIGDQILVKPGYKWDYISIFGYNFRIKTIRVVVFILCAMLTISFLILNKQKNKTK